jgi:hypothetical protein
VGVDPVEVRENPRPAAKNLLFSKVKGIKKVPNISGLDVGVDPVGLRENPRPSACKEKKTSFQIFNTYSKL